MKTRQSLSRMEQRLAIICFVAVAGYFLIPLDLPASSGSRIDTEMQNLRALPLGYRAWCEDGNLLFRSKASAGFRISNAALCAGKPDGYVVCTSDREAGPATARKKIPLCSEIDAPNA